MSVLDQIISVQEAAELWGLSADHVKKLCRDGEIQTKKIGNTWVVFRDQPNPKKYNLKGMNKMRFLNFMFIDKKDNLNEVLFNYGSEHDDTTLELIYQESLEHHVFWWIKSNVEPYEFNGITCYEFSKEKIKQLHDACSRANAEKLGTRPEPWKFMPIPNEDSYPYYIAEYQKEYEKIYYDSVYRYQTVLSVILNIFDFENKRLVVMVR